MNRRKFLNWLGTASAIPAFAPLAKLFRPKVPLLAYNWNGTERRTISAFAETTGMTWEQANKFITSRCKEMGYYVQVIDDQIQAVPL